MATKIITWADGSTAILTYTGKGNGTIVVTGDPNNHYEVRSAQVTVRTTDGSNLSQTITVVQAAKIRTDISSAVVTAANQTYSGSALTPTPTVTLNGTTVPSSGYDVAYSNNTNAGTATITITGKGDYTGIATGTFIINKANPTYTAPTARTGLTYSGSSQYLVNAGSTSHGTIQYSSDGTTWSTTRPSSTNAGSYTTYWRLVGDSNHNDVASTSLSTTIAKASRTLSFADTYVVLAPSGNITKTATPSAGSGDGAITYSISNTTYATINSSSGKVTAKTSDGSAVVTAIIAEGTNYLSATASYNLYVFATTHNYDYNGSYRNVTLPPGTYQFQCWGAQGGSNAADSTHGITAQAGGKGGYSVGQLTVAQSTDVRVYVGGQGSSSAGGYNGGGTTTGSSTSDSGGEEGVSRMGGGGGATDIRLSDGSLYSRMIVAGGGSGGAMAYKKVTTNLLTINKSEFTACGLFLSHAYGDIFKSSTLTPSETSAYYDVTNYRGKQFTIQNTLTSKSVAYGFYKNKPVDGGTPDPASVSTGWNHNWSGDTTYKNYVGANNTVTGVVPSDASYFWVMLTSYSASGAVDRTPNKVMFFETSSTTQSQVGYVGGGTSGGGYSDTYKGRQNAAGYSGSFGQGANMEALYVRYCAAAGGGGWYGGGTYWGGGTIDHVYKSGGGSGFVNTSASAGNRPSGYTSLQLDSGETKAGNTSFPAPGGGNETGHAGHGYARITRIS